jgi:aldose 1-epimerase
MQPTRDALLLLPLLLLSAGCGSFSKSMPSAKEIDPPIGGRKAVELTMPKRGDGKSPQFLSVTLLPGRGMNIYQVKAFLPSKGEVDLFTAPPLEEAQKLLSGDEYGNSSFKVGGALLAPYANRIRGSLSSDGKSVDTMLGAQQVRLPANWKGVKPGAEPHAMHGLILDQVFDNVSYHGDTDQSNATATLDAGTFHGHWPSRTQLDFFAALKESTFRFSLTAKNTGDVNLPMGIGWHPYFAFPSGNREQVRLRLPAEKRAIVNNYDDVFPTGALVPTKGSPYDFNAPGGAALNKLFMDDCFVGLKKNGMGEAIAEIVDPAAKYGLRIKGISAEIQAYQAYAPVDKSFIALEPQFNWGDPYSKVWKPGTNTGMVVLKPGESVTYTVELELFIP